MSEGTPGRFCRSFWESVMIFIASAVGSSSVVGVPPLTGSTREGKYIPASSNHADGTWGTRYSPSFALSVGRVCASCVWVRPNTSTKARINKALSSSLMLGANPPDHATSCTLLQNFFISVVMPGFWKMNDRCAMYPSAPPNCCAR